MAQIVKVLEFAGCGLLLVGVLFSIGCRSAAEAKEPLTIRLDDRGPYLILVTRAAQESYVDAIGAARKLHPDADVFEFDPGDFDELLVKLREKNPRYALVFLKPDELDVNFAWRWFALSTQLDNDPFVDVRSGFITGATPSEVEAFVQRIASAAKGETPLIGKLVDNFGPNPQAKKDAFYQSSGNFFMPMFGERLGLETITHGPQGFTDARLSSMNRAGLIHLGGHGHPDRVDDGLIGTQARRLTLDPCVVFNGCCYTGVTSRWFDQWTAGGKVAERKVEAADSFCINLLSNQVLAYLAAMHPDHGIPVYQEMEFMAYSGASLGDVMKHTHDGVILGSGGKPPEFEEFKDGTPSPKWTPSEVMLKGTAARLLFGDPSLIVGGQYLKPPFEVSVEKADQSLVVTATLANSALRATFTDTYHADLAWNPNGFNDRALVTINLPGDWKSSGRVEVVSAKSGKKDLRNRVVAFATENDGDATRLHVQVDFATTAYMQSEWRSAKSKLVLRISE